MSETDLSESTGSLDWAIVDQKGTIPGDDDDDDDDSVSSVEVVNEDDDEDESDECHGTPLAGSPISNLPKFVLRLPSQSNQNVSDTDEDQTDVNNEAFVSGASIISVPESLPSSTEISTSTSEPDIAGQTYRQGPSIERISQEELEDLCNKIDDLKKTLEPDQSVERVTADELFGDGKSDAPNAFNQHQGRLVSEVENLHPGECANGDTSMQSSVSSSFSFLSRDATTETQADSGVHEETEEREPEPLLVEQILTDQVPDNENPAWEPTMEQNAREPAPEPENVNDLLQVELGQNYLCTVISYFFDYRDILKWIIGFGSVTGLVVATVVFFSAPAPHTEPVSARQHCHGDECLTDGYDLAERKADQLNRIKELENQININEEFILKLQNKKENKDKKICELKKTIKNLEFQFHDLLQEKERLEDRNERYLSGWKKEWQEALAKVTQLEKHSLAIEAKLEEVKADRVNLAVQLESCQLETGMNVEDKGKSEEKLMQAQKELYTVREKCRDDVEKVRGQCKTDLDKVRSQCQSDLDRLKHHHRDDLDRVKHQSDIDVENALKSCQKSAHENRYRRSSEDHHDEDSYYNDDDDSSNKGSHGNSDEFSSHSRIAESVLAVMNLTRHQIENTWEKVKNMSESLWKDNEPTLRKVQQSFTEELMNLNERFQTKMARKWEKFRKWLGKGKKQDGSAKTKRRNYEQDSSDGKPLTVEQRLVKLSHKVDSFSDKTFRRTYRKQPAELEKIQAEFKDIDGTKKIPHSYADKVKWKDFILTDRHLKWLRCQQQWWEDYFKVADNCYMELCCWQVKIANGNTRACKKFKRRLGLVEDQCYLELPKEEVGTDEDLSDKSNLPSDKPVEDDEENIKEDNWYFEMAEDRDYQRTEPDDWFFRRKNRDSSDHIGSLRKSKSKYMHMNGEIDDDFFEDDVVIDDDDEYGPANGCYPDSCDFP